jgi:hypothetical protein
MVVSLALVVAGLGLNPLSAGSRPLQQALPTAGPATAVATRTPVATPTLPSGLTPSATPALAADPWFELLLRVPGAARIPVQITLHFDGRVPEPVLLKISPSGATLIHPSGNAGGGAWISGDPNPEAWACYRAFVLTGGRLGPSSHTLCYVAVGPGPLLRDVYFKVSRNDRTGRLWATIEMNPSCYSFGTLTLRCYVVALPMDGSPPRVQLVPGAGVLRPPRVSEEMGDTPTCYLALYGNPELVRPVSEVVCAVPRSDMPSP